MMTRCSFARYIYCIDQLCLYSFPKIVYWYSDRLLCGGGINYFSMSGVLPLGNLCDFPPEWKFEVSLLAQWHLICSAVLVVLAFKFWLYRFLPGLKCILCHATLYSFFYSTTLLPNVSVIAQGLFCGAEYTHHTFTPIINDNTTN